MLRSLAANLRGRLVTAVDPRPQMAFYIDVFGFCNLRCPSCPVGNWSDDPAVFHHGLMSKELLGAILDKAMRECRVRSVGLFNWTEPLLHPQIHELIALVRSRGLHCGISSNLNVLRSPDLLMAANPDWMRVSVSGFTQEIYVRGHKEGDIEKVKTNMRRLAEAKRDAGATTDLELYFHKYVDNERDEGLMRDYAQSLGYRFATGWAVMMPVEKVLTYANPREPRATLTGEDHIIMDRLALKTDEALAISAKHKIKSCSLQDDYVAIDVNGNVTLCCGVMASAENIIGSYLSVPIDELQSVRRKHTMCGPCMSHGLPVIFNFLDPKFDEIGKRERARHEIPVA